MNCKIIEIKLYDETYIFTPINYYIIQDTDIQLDQHVIMYKLNYSKSNIASENYEAHIPYYISNGHTNKLKAYLLLPFICFDMKDSTTCPIAPNYSKGVLLKYSIGLNMNLKLIRQWIEQSLKDKYNIDVIYNDKQNDIVGITSVLPRLSNILDYIIAVSSDWIINIQEYKCYRPSGNPLLHQDPNNALNPNYIDDTSNLYSIEDYYRVKIVQALHDQIIHLQRYNYLEIKTINLPTVLITRSKFNSDIVKLYENFENSIINGENYFKISEKLRMTYKRKTTHLLNDSECIKDKSCFNFITNFNLILLNQTLIESHDGEERHVLQTNLESWSHSRDTRFDLKYKKYKYKYLQLKNKLI